MRLIKQRNRHRPEEGVWGDCHRAAIAMVLDLEIDAVPHAYEGGVRSQDANKILKEWREPLGLFEITIIYPGETSLENIMESLRHLNPGTPYILGGTSKNGTDHSVAVLDGEIFDPAIDDSGIVGPMSDGLWWVTYIVRKPK